MSLLVMLLTWNLLPGHAASQDQSAYIAARQATRSHRQQRIASSLHTASQMVKGRGPSAIRTLVAPTLRLRHDGGIEVYIYTSDQTQSDLQALQQHGVRILRVHQQSGIVYASLPIDALPTVAALPFVRWIAPPSYGVLRTGSVVSAGDMRMRADEVRTNMGVDGRGVRIGITSDSLINLQASVDSGDLPSNLIIVDGQDGSTVPDTVDEGRAMAEIIHDLAPGATLLFHSALPTSLDTIAAIRALTAADADIIVDDIGFATEPVFEDGPVAQAVQEAIDNGAVYVTAAGNDAMQHYHALYKEFDPNDNNPVVNLHDFGGADTTMAITIAPGSFLFAALQWPEPFDGSAPRADYDLFLFDASGTVDACTLPGLTGSCASTDKQLGGNAPPVEVVFVDNTTDSAVTVTVVINRFDGASLPLVLNFNGQIMVQEHNVARGSVFGHPCVRDALAVGAIDVDDPGFDTMESFSSQGPCEIFFPVFDVRTKPDVAGADGVVTSVSGFDTASPFFGTSAAAPHVAAVAALLIEAAGGPGTRSNAQIANIMRRAALDLGEPGNDNTSGHGVGDAFEAASLLQSATNTAPQSTIDSPSNDVVILPLTTLTFQGACIDAEENFPLSFAWGFGGAAAPATVQSPGAITFSSPGTFPVSFTCTDAAGLSDATPAIHTVTVNQPPQSRIVGLPGNVIITAGSRVDFAGVCTDAENHVPFRFLWFFGGGADIARSTQQNPHDVRFDTAGQFTVSFTCHDALETADPVPATVRIFVNPSSDQGSPGVGGGCSILPGDQLASLSPLEAIGNLLLPLVVMVIVRAGCRLRRNARRAAVGQAERRS